MNAVSITFTGADGNTRGSDVCLIAECARECGVDVELALLWSRSNGRERYPTGNMARALWNRIASEGLRCAVHVCGSAADRLLDPPADGEGIAHDLSRIAASDEDSRLWIKTIRDVAVGGGRVQVNVRADEPSPLTRQLSAVRDGIQQIAMTSVGVDASRLTVIGQHRGEGAWPAPVHGVAWLYDASGGRGLVIPDAWPELPDYPVGLAGGLGPCSGDAFERNTRRGAAVAAEVLARKCGGWVDMESRIRTEGRLDPALCCRVIREVAEALAR